MVMPDLLTYEYHEQAKYIHEKFWQQKQLFNISWPYSRIRSAKLTNHRVRSN